MFRSIGHPARRAIHCTVQRRAVKLTFDLPGDDDLYDRTVNPAMLKPLVRNATDNAPTRVLRGCLFWIGCH